MCGQDEDDLRVEEHASRVVGDCLIRVVDDVDVLGDHFGVVDGDLSCRGQLEV